MFCPVGIAPTSEECRKETMRDKEWMRRPVVFDGRDLIPVHLGRALGQTQHRAHGAKNILGVLATVTHFCKVKKTTGTLLQGMPRISLHLFTAQFSRCPVIHQVIVEWKGICRVAAAAAARCCSLLSFNSSLFASPLFLRQRFFVVIHCLLSL